MKKYYLIPTWLLVFSAIIAENTVTKIILLCLSGVQSIQLLLYAKDAWLLNKVKLIIFSVFSIGVKYDEDGRSAMERQMKEEICRQNDEMKKIVHHDIYVMYRNAEEKCRVIMQEANNKAAAITYKAEETIQKELDLRISQIENDYKLRFVLPRYVPSKLDYEKIEAIDLFVLATSSIDSPLESTDPFKDEEMNRKMWAFIDSEFQKIEIMFGYEFENYCKEILQKIGFSNITVTKRSGDYGADIIAEKDFVSYAIQCKRYEGNVGNDSIQQIYAAKEYYKKDIAVVFTNSCFTESAKQMGKQMSVRLWDKQTLVRFLMICYFRDIIYS